MYIAFGWGEKPVAKDMKYEVSDYSFSVYNKGQDQKPDNCLPGTISMTIVSPVSKDPGKEFLDYAAGQLDAVKKKGAGKISVFAGKNVGESLQDVVFTDGWLVDFSFRPSVSSDVFVFSVTIAAGCVSMSGVEFAHPGRLAAIPK